MMGFWWEMVTLLRSHALGFRVDKGSCFGTVSVFGILKVRGPTVWDCLESQEPNMCGYFLLVLEVSDGFRHFRVQYPCQ